MAGAILSWCVDVVMRGLGLRGGVGLGVGGSRDASMRQMHTQDTCAVLCCAVLCCAVLCCAVLCRAVLCCAVLCCAVPCCAVPSIHDQSTTIIGNRGLMWPLISKREGDW